MLIKIHEDLKIFQLKLYEDNDEQSSRKKPQVAKMPIKKIKMRLNSQSVSP